MSPLTTRAAARTALVLAAGLALAALPATAASAAQDTACQQAGIAKLKSLGVFSAVARGGLAIETAVAVGVEPRMGTDVASLPNPLPLPVILADHRAGDDSLFIYPWCD